MVRKAQKIIALLLLLFPQVFLHGQAATPVLASLDSQQTIPFSADAVAVFVDDFTVQR